MKKLLLASLFAASCVLLHAQYPTASAGALALPTVNSAANNLIANFPPPPSSGHFSIVIHDNVSNPGTPYSENAIPSAAFVYNPTTKVLDVQPAVVARSFNNTPSAKTIVTTAGAANGFQVSATRDASVNYSVSITTTVSLSGNATGYVVLEIAATNSTNAADWVEVGRAPSGQSGTLVVGLTLTQTGGGQLGAIIPAGWYARLRSVNTSGTPSYTYLSGQEVLL